MVVESFRFFKGLKDTPKKINELLQDLEGSIGRINALQITAKQSSSPLFSSSDATQLGRLQVKLDAARHAMAELQECLVPLSSTRKVGRVNQAWRSIVSVAKEKSIMEKLSRAQRLDQEILAELAISSLDTMHKTK